MSNIEPTEEQWRAANNIADGQYRAVCKIADVAHLLAEREAKRDHCVRIGVDAGRGERDALRLENDTLRARVAELENSLAACKRTLFDDDKYWRAIEAQHLARIAELETVYESYREARARIAEMEEANVLLQRAYSLACNERNALTDREAQHLADIKALMGCCRGLVHDVDRLMCGIDVGRHAMVMRATLQRLAHYDDAKAAEGGEG